MADLHFSPRQFRVSRPHFWNNAGLVRRLMLFCLPVPLAIMIALFAITHKNVEENLANAIAQNSYILSQSMGIALSQTLQETRNQIVTLATGSTSFQEFEHRIWRRLEILNSMGDARFCEAAFLGLGAQAGKRFLWIQDKGKMRSISPELTDVQPSSPFHLPLRQPEEHEVSLSIPTEVSYSFTDPDNTTSQTQLTVQLMRFTTPVTLGNGDFAGYLILSIDLDWLCEVTSRCAISMRNDLAPPPAFFVDSAGWMIFETNTKQGSAEQPAAIDSVRSGFQGDFGRAGYPQGFRPGGDYYSYWTMMNHIQKKEAGQFQTSKTPWNKEGLPVETVSYAPVLYTSGAAGRTDVVGGIVVLDTSLAATNQRSLMLRHYLIACAAAVFFLALAMFCTGIALRKTLHYLRRDIAEAGASALAKPLPERSAPKEVCEVRTEVNKLLEQLRMLEDERDMENTLTSARIEVEEAHNLPGDIPVPPDGIIGVSSEIRTLRQNILQAAMVQADVLVMGETGTGKELVSRAIHMHSAHKDGPFMTINCGALDESLLMDSLFGHVKGAFSEARDSRKGAFLTAEGGTLMLDEVGNASPKVQQALLRALSDRRITPLGSDTSIPFNTRVIAATNAELREEIQKGTFREDLYFRLAVITIHTVPLREHKMDIPYLALFFLRQAHEQSHATRPIPGLSKGALSRLMHYHWPGNVRELSNTIFRTAAFCDGDIILPHHLQLGADQGAADTKTLLREQARDQGRMNTPIPVADAPRAGAAKSGAAKPGAAKPGAAKPDAPRNGAAKPAATQPDATNNNAAQADAAVSAAGEPARAASQAGTGSQAMPPAIPAPRADAVAGMLPVPADTAPADTAAGGFDRAAQAAAQSEPAASALPDTVSQAEQRAAEPATSARSKAPGARETSSYARLERIFAAVQAAGEFSRKDYQELAGVSARTAQYDLQVFVEDGLLERKGKGPSQRYLLRQGAQLPGSV